MLVKIKFETSLTRCARGLFSIPGNSLDRWLNDRYLQCISLSLIHLFPQYVRMQRDGKFWTIHRDSSKYRREFVYDVSLRPFSPFVHRRSIRRDIHPVSGISEVESRPTGSFYPRRPLPGIKFVPDPKVQRAFVCVVLQRGINNIFYNYVAGSIKTPRSIHSRVSPAKARARTLLCAGFHYFLARRKYHPYYSHNARAKS